MKDTIHSQKTISDVTEGAGGDAVHGIDAFAWQTPGKALSKKPEERFASCVDFDDALEGKKPASARVAKSQMRPVIVGAAVLLAAVLVLWGASACQKPAPAPAPEPAPSVAQAPAFGGTVSLPNGVYLEMVNIKAGSFQMGSPSSEKDRGNDETQHRVTLTRDYWLGRYEVTQEQYEAVMGTNPSYFKNGGRFPVEDVSWVDADAFCEKLNDLYAGRLPSGYKFGLPTEAQWEYAVRGGGKSRHYKYSGGNDCDSVAWYDENSGIETHIVGQKQANELGLCDMSGNVWEWCRDWYDSYGGDATDPTGPVSGSHRVRRGGSWNYDAGYCRAALRDYNVPSLRCNFLGFRLALVPVQ